VTRVPRLQLPISNPDKVFWPEEGYTKLDLLLFYLRVFPRLAPYVRDRLLSLERCPDGMRGECFYQKERPPGLPKDTPTKRIEHGERVTNYVVGGRCETQIALANLGCIAIHVWGSRAAHPRQPDWVCFDLDPDSGEFADAARAARHVKAALDALDLRSFVKTSGGRGVHVFVPIRIGPTTEEVTAFASTLGARLAAAYPAELTVEARIAKRRGRVYLDALRNGFGQTVAAPYSVRRRAGAPVSTPLAWAELRPSLDPVRFNLRTFARRLAAADPWRDFFRRRQVLAPALRAVQRL
jgi:bifunctional non-homologous end joining protein LigD